MLFLFPVIAALIGWIIARLALRLLFRPIRPVKLFGFRIQGFLPSKLPYFSERVATLISNEFVASNEISARIADPGNFQKILPQVEEHIDQFLKVKLAEKMPMVSMFIGENTTRQLKSVFMEELAELFPKLMQQYMEKLKSEFDLSKIIAAKINSYSAEKLEKMLKSSLKQQFLRIEVLGAAMGLTIGLIQLLLMSIS